ncbi:hypothetical protein CHU98_g8098 [Xylaria longipes]|nr:hypothetical protein CHU98_g8098 [Xylaria longipes]
MATSENNKYSVMNKTTVRLQRRGWSDGVTCDGRRSLTQVYTLLHKSYARQSVSYGYSISMKLETIQLELGTVARDEATKPLGWKPVESKFE